MYVIKKDFAFCASHHLEGLPEVHPCSRNHGHNYTVSVYLRSGEVDKVGMVVDYRELDCMKKMLDDVFDHQNLNEVVIYNPTAENLAKDFYDMFKRMVQEVFAVEVSETPKTMARYEGY